MSEKSIRVLEYKNEVKAITDDEIFAARITADKGSFNITLSNEVNMVVETTVDFSSIISRFANYMVRNLSTIPLSIEEADLAKEELKVLREESKGDKSHLVNSDMSFYIGESDLLDCQSGGEIEQMINTFISKLNEVTDASVVNFIIEHYCVQPTNDMMAMVNTKGSGRLLLPDTKTAFSMMSFIKEKLQLECGREITLNPLPPEYIVALNDSGIRETIEMRSEMKNELMDKIVEMIGEHSNVPEDILRRRLSRISIFDEEGD